jgi:hypothetical protein
MSAEPLTDEKPQPFPPIREPLTGDVAFAADDPRYPEFNKWLDPEKQQKLGYAIGGVAAVWTVLYLICSLAGVDHQSPPYIAIMFLPWVNLLLAVGLLVGSVSQMNLRAKLGYIFVMLPFIFIGIWPRLAVPIAGGFMAPFTIYMCLNHIYDLGLVQWAKFSIATYMTCVAPGVALFNILWFKAWCAGYYPKIIYVYLAPALMVLGTVKEIKKAEEDKDTAGIDYAVNIPMAKLLVPFRVGVLGIAIGVGMTFVQEALLGLLREDVWACTPLPF